jgi:hypothetical protein
MGDWFDDETDGTNDNWDGAGIVVLETVIFTHSAIADEHITEIRPKLWLDASLTLWQEMGPDPKGILCIESIMNYRTRAVMGLPETYDS